MTYPETVIQVALSQLGTTEDPAGSNKVKYNEWYGVNGIPWCATFVSWVLDRAGMTELHGLQNPRGAAYCPYIEKFYRDQKRWDGKPSPGAIVLFDWDSNGVSNHIGIVEKVIDPVQILTIEGNTSISDDSNGGIVMRRKRRMTQVRGFGHPLYRARGQRLADIQRSALHLLSYEDLGMPPLYLCTPELTSPIVEHVQSRLIELGLLCESSLPSAVFDPLTEKAVMEFQAQNGLDITGFVEESTWNALFSTPSSGA